MHQSFALFNVHCVNCRVIDKSFKRKYLLSFVKWGSSQSVSIFPKTKRSSERPSSKTVEVQGFR